MTSPYPVGDQDVDWFLTRNPTKTDLQLKEFLDRCEANPMRWQVLSVHASMNAARTKVTKTRQGYMANTIRQELALGNIEIGVTNNTALGPAVVVRWKK